MLNRGWTYDMFDRQRLHRRKGREKREPNSIEVFQSNSKRKHVCGIITLRLSEEALGRSAFRMSRTWCPSGFLGGAWLGVVGGCNAVLDEQQLPDP